MAQTKVLIYTCDHNKPPKKAGIYVFGRRYGTKIEALYVGRAELIQGRLRGQFKNSAADVTHPKSKGRQACSFDRAIYAKAGAEDGKMLRPFSSQRLIGIFFRKGTIL